MTAERLNELCAGFRKANATDSEIRAAFNDARSYSESIDNIRAAMEQKSTHYLVTADDVGELYDYVKDLAASGQERARMLMAKLHANGNFEEESK